MRFMSLILVIAVFLTGESPLALAYEVMNVEAGGTIRGTVTLKGAAPSPKAYNLLILNTAAVFPMETGGDY
jgi:hypothetical protein